MTYDRVLKVDPAKIRLANAFHYPFPTYESVVPTSAKETQTYKYTSDKPADNWFGKSYDDSGWKSGPGGFGTSNTADTGKVGTVWNTNDIWLRRTFTLPHLSAAQQSQLVLTDSHDDDVEVYINGVLAFKGKGWIGNYENVLMTDEALHSLVPGGENVFAVHCKQNNGGQYIDVGLSLRTPPKVLKPYRERAFLSGACCGGPILRHFRHRYRYENPSAKSDMNSLGPLTWLDLVNMSSVRSASCSATSPSSRGAFLRFARTH
ncbi:hypothetical protein IAD21_00263 [Abditibacteriota bacterium]|nr:hypothetical protein IAD21_00263 [Abditibacteriota bacterium]